MTSKVKLHMDAMLPAEKTFCKKFGLTRNHIQGKGTGWDAEDAQGFRYEFKDDRSAAKTGNVFLEIAQSQGVMEDGSINWVPSGFQLSLMQAKYLVFKVATDYIVLIADELDIYLNEHPKKSKEIITRPYANGNAPGKHAKGLLIKVADLKSVPGTRVVQCE